MFTCRISYMNLKQIADSGQCFRWRELDAVDGWEYCYEIPAFGRILRVCQKEDLFSFDCSEEEFQTIWSDYFDLSGDYEGYLKRIDREDAYLCRAASYGSGIRILRQDPWEAAVSFLISQCNNIPRIKGCIEKICRNFGEDGVHFPDAERLSTLSEEELRIFKKECSLGYRDEYILQFAHAVSSGEFSLEECGKLPYKACVDKLKTLHGVGQKVADCIALFGFYKIDAFPIDVHMKQLLYANYLDDKIAGLSKNRQIKAMEQKYFDRYEGFKGVVQQWIFAYDLHGGI